MGKTPSQTEKKSKKSKSKKTKAETRPEDNIKPETPSKSSPKSSKPERKSKKRKQTEFDVATMSDSEATTTADESASESDTDPSQSYSDELLRKHPSILQRFKESVSLSRQQQQQQHHHHDEDHQMNDEPSVPARPLAPLPQPIQQRIKHIGPIFTGLPQWLEAPETFPSTLSKPFHELGINEKTVKRLKKHGWEEGFAVQSAMIPLLLRRWFDYQDLLVQAPTGSGKTLGYALPMIEKLRHRMWPEIRGLVIVPTRELVMQVRDTFEKAASGTKLSIGFSVGGRSLRMERDLFLYDRGPSLSGVEWKRYHPRIDILITTPGRLVEHIKTTPGLDFDTLRWLVIDEADQLLSQEYQNWVPVLMDKLKIHDPKNWPGKCDLFGDGTEVDLADYGFPRPFGYPWDEGLRKVIVSASMTRNMGLLSDLNLNKNPKLIVIEPSDGGSKKSRVAEKKAEREAEKKKKKAERAKRRAEHGEEGEEGEHYGEGEYYEPQEEAAPESDSESETPEEILSVPATLREHYALVDDIAEKPLILLSLILEQGMSSGVLIFTRTNDSAARLARLLEIIYDLKAQDPAASVHKPKRIGLTTGAIDKKARKKVVRKFKAGEIDILICSDLISRGLDLPLVHNVINYDVPHSTRIYIHRVGRTARAGKEGDAYTLVTGRELKWFVKSIGSIKKIKRAPGRVLERVHVDTGIDLGLRGVYKEALGRLAEEVKAKARAVKGRSRNGGSA